MTTTCVARGHEGPLYSLLLLAQLVGPGSRKGKTRWQGRARLGHYCGKCLAELVERLGGPDTAVTFGEVRSGR